MVAVMVTKMGPHRTDVESRAHQERGLGTGHSPRQPAARQGANACAMAVELSVEESERCESCGGEVIYRASPGEAAWVCAFCDAIVDIALHISPSV
jgi:hypothetical protein